MRRRLPIPNVLTSVEVTAQTGRAKDEIVRDLNAAKQAASELSRQLAALRQESIKASESTATQSNRVKDLQNSLSRASSQLKETNQQISVHKKELREIEAIQSNKIKDLQTNLGRTSTQLKDTNQQLSFHRKELREAEKAYNDAGARLDKVNKQMGVLGTASGSSAQYAKTLKVAQQELTSEMARASQQIDERNASLARLNTQQQTQQTAQKLLVNGIINEREQLNLTKEAHRNATKEKEQLAQQQQKTTRQLSNEIINERNNLNKTKEAQQRVNTEKQKATQTSQQAENAVRSLNKELREHESAQRKAAQEAKHLTDSQLALANVVGHVVYNAFRNLLTIGKDFIVETAIYAARTDETRLAMLNMAKQSGYTRGELLRQEEAIRTLNITTQEARDALVKFQLAQLDVSKAATLARVAQDLAVVAGVETGEELNRLVHGITTLQTRVLRTAGVYISLEQTYKEVAIATGRSTESFSEAEKQQFALNKVIEVGQRAAGNYETSLDNAGKRMRSMTRIYQDMMNAIGAPLQGPFGDLVDVLSGVMSVITLIPKGIGLLLLALIAVGVQMTKNIGATTGWGVRLKILTTELTNAMRATLGYSTAAYTAANGTEVAAKAAVGWRSALTAIGGTLGKIAASLALINIALSVFAEISKAIGGTTKYQDITDGLEVEQSKVNELRADYESLNIQRQALLDKGFINKAGREQGVGGVVSRLIDDIPLIGSITSEYSAEGIARRAKEAEDALEKVSSGFARQRLEMGLTASMQREYIDAVNKAGKTNLDFSATTEVLGFRLDRVKKQFEALGEPIDKDTGYVLTLAERLNTLKPEILAIDLAMQQAATSQEDYNNKIAEAEARFPGFTKALVQLRGEGDKFIRGVGEDVGEMNRRFIDLQRRLTAMVREIRGLFGEGTEVEKRAGNLELLEKRLQIVRQEIDAINSARINLNRDVGQPIPQGREARIELQNAYELSIKVRDEVRAARRANKDFAGEVAKTQQLAATARKDLVSAELTAAKLIAESQIKRIQDERQLTAEIIALTKQRADAALDEAGTQKQSFASVYKEQLETLTTLEANLRRVRAQQTFYGATDSIGGLDIPQFDAISTALEDIALPEATQSENIAAIASDVASIEKIMEEDLRKRVNEHPKGPWSPELLRRFGLMAPAPPTAPSSIEEKYRLNPKGPWAPEVHEYFRNRPAQPTTSNAPKNLQSMVSFIESQGFAVISTTGGRHNEGSAHYDARAADVRTKGRRAEEVEALIAAGRAAGYNVLDERTRPKGQKVWDGPHVHFQIGGRGQSGGYNLEQQVGSPVYSPIQARTTQRVQPLTPSQISAAMRWNLARQNIINRQQFGTYEKSREADTNFLSLRAETSTNELEQFKRNTDEIRLINKRMAEDFYEGEENRKLVFQATELSRKREAISTHNTIMQLNEDERTGWRQSAEYEIKVSEEAQIRIREAFNSSFDNLRAAQEDQKKRTEYHEKYIATIRNNGEADRIRFSQNAEDRYNAMLEETNSRWRESMEFRLAQWQNFETQRMNATRTAEDEIAELQYQIEHAGETDPLKIEAARLRAILEIREADGEAAAEMAANAVRIADAQIYHSTRANARVLEYIAQQKGLDEIVSDARIGFMESLFSAMDTGLAKVTSKLGIFQGVVNTIISSFARLALSRAFMALFGLSSTGGTTVTGGASIVNSVFGPGGTPTFSGAPSGVGGVVQQFISNLTRPRTVGGGGGIFDLGSTGVNIPASVTQQQSIGGIGTVLGQTQIGKGGFLQGLGSVASSFLPTLPFLGAGLGASLGGQSRLGNILGAAGGAAAGLIPTLFGISSFLGPAAIVAAPLLLIGAAILGRNAKRRENEKKRDAFTTDAISQLNTLLSQVRRDRIGGDEALAQAAQIRVQYMTAAQSLNDSKTRNIALKDVSRLDGIINQIKAAGVAQLRRQELNANLVAEFGGGSYIVPGPSGAGDIIPALLTPGELVLNAQQASRIPKQYLSGVPNYVANQRYAGGGYAKTVTSNSTVGNIYLVTDRKFAEEMAEQGKDKIVDLASTSVRRHEKLYAAIRTNP